MFLAGGRDYLANRWEPFVRTVYFEGYNFTGASFLMQVRAVRDTDGTALVNLATVASIGTEGVNIVGVTTTNGTPTTQISIRINEATVEAIAKATPIGAEYPLFYDIQITPSGGNKFRALEGAFILHAGVTH